MGSLFRLGGSKIARLGSSGRLCKVTQNHNVVPVACMVREAKMDRKFPRPPFYPYWKQYFGAWGTNAKDLHYLYDVNSRLIVVEGLPAIGKTEVAKKIAEEFDMFYMPAPTFDELYITPYGYDLRTMDQHLPEDIQTCDLKKFLTNPKHPNVPVFQLNFLLMRMEQYLRAILHIFATGQGVVLNRCMYSDQCFMNAMIKEGHIKDDIYTIYNALMNHNKHMCLRPHLVVYLDAPVDAIMKKIKERGIPEEVNSKVLTPSFLQNVESYYMNKYLPDLSTHTHVLFYDWTKKGDLDVICDEIEDLDLDTYEIENGKLSDWVVSTFGELFDKRMEYDVYAEDEMVNGLAGFGYNIPKELLLTGEQMEIYDKVKERVPGTEYSIGYNGDLDDGTLRKENRILRLLIRLSPRDFLDPVLQKMIRENIDGIKD